MSTTVAFINYSTKAMAHPQILIGVPAFALGTLGTASRLYKQVNADDVDFRFDALSSQGVLVSEDGTPRAGGEAYTGASTPTAAATTHLITADSSGGVITVTLQPAATVGAGFKMWIFLSADGNNLVIDGDGSETVLGTLTQTLATAGDMLEIESDGVSAWVAHT
jgi:hypothetical protein